MRLAEIAPRKVVNPADGQKVIIFPEADFLKRFILDTNVLLHDPQALNAFGNNEVVIPISVLDELDRIKAFPDEKGRNARAVIRRLDELRKSGSLNSGVEMPGGSVLRVELNHKTTLPYGLSDSVDNRILSTAMGLSKDECEKQVVVTKDINLRVKCDAMGLCAEDYDRGKLSTTPSTLYSGVGELMMLSKTVDRLYSEGFLNEEETEAEGFPNQFFIVRASDRGGQTALARFMPDGRLRLVRPKASVWGVSPRNAEQRMAVELLMDPSVSLVTLIGRAGSGKTLLAAAAALQHVMDPDANFQRALLSRPIEPMGRDIGFLPGGIEEKLSPWMAALNDNLELLVADPHMLDSYKENGIIQVEPLTYIRGRSIPNSFFILDECQNLTPQEVKTVVTRIGEGSKIVLTGDIEQIDNPYIDFASNGLTHAIEMLKKYAMTGHVTLRKGERSELATLAAEVL